MTAYDNSLADLVRAKIENLRPKLLDLSRRNPLIATKLGPRSNSLIRVVDELPDVLFFKLNNSQEMTLIPLPPLEEDPRDELTKTFREALINARLTDETYLRSMKDLDRDADSFLDSSREIERALKDRVREQLGLPPRVRQAEVNLTQHAKNNGIQPSYDLPKADAVNGGNASHSDDNIQTLLLPVDLERKLNAILSKSRTWVQETGMNVLHVALGFLEWCDDLQSDSSLAPLILLQVEIDRTRTTHGPIYSVRGIGDEPELNAVLAEKLRIDFAVELPKFDGSSIESYLATIGQVLPKKEKWRVRRQIAIGVFPSARMAMYHDLDPQQSGFPKSEIVQSILVGTETEGASPFADEYDVDSPEIEKSVPCLVMDADSSQFSTLADIAKGKNVAVEGPPGTGKSQTIVNAIAAALSSGKKVLFVAEKLAALNVVKARLEAIGLGEFLLPLQAEKSTREQVIESIRQRLEMRDSRAVRDYEEKLKELRTVRKQLSDYIDLITTDFENSGLTVYAILGKSIATNARLTGISSETVERCQFQPESQNASGFTSLRTLGSQLEKSHAVTLSSGQSWKSTQLVHPDRFTVEEACTLARRAASEVSQLADLRRTLSEWKLDTDQSIEHLKGLMQCLATHLELLDQHPAELIIKLLTDSNAEALSSFIEQCGELETAETALADVLSREADGAALRDIDKVESICERASLISIHTPTLIERIGQKEKSANAARSILTALEPLVSVCEAAKDWQIDDVSKAHELYREAGRESVLLRNSKLADETAIFHLMKFCEEGRVLVEDRTNLATRISISDDVPFERLEAFLEILRSAGAFRIFSKSYRDAKRVARSLLRDKKYSRTGAIRSLEDLIAFRRRRDEFLRQAEISGFFSHYYRGLDTQFELFERLAKYYHDIKLQFASPDLARIAYFLQEAPPASLDLLPKLRLTGVKATFTDLRDRISRVEKEIRVIETAITDLGGVSEVFKDPQIEVDAIRLARVQVSKLLAGQERINSNLLVKELLGPKFAGYKTDGQVFEPITTWALSCLPFREELKRVISHGRIADLTLRIADIFRLDEKLDATFVGLSEVAKIDATAFVRGGSLTQAASALEAAAQDHEGLIAHAMFATALQEVAPLGILPLVEERLRTGASLVGLGDQIEAFAIRQLAKAVYRKLGHKLTKYPGSKLNELRLALAEKDKEIIQLSRRKLRADVKSKAKPPRGNGVGRKSAWTQMALIENEISKKQKFIPVRDLTQRAGKALFEIKPCWMMSPLAVAQYIPKGTMQFDLCIIDEASQMPPESAIGALLRCDQAVVVGDTNQLPPSSFFKTLVDDEDETDEDEAVLNESVLEMANGAFRPARRLRWHYRSKHSGLIKFSNRLVYDDSLIVFPSATESMSRMGVEFRKVDGIYKAGTNPVEAKIVTEAILEFMRTDPTRSLGVVTLNQKQRDLIIEEFEYASANNPAVQKYIDTWKEKNDGLEEFFIKNLENVQGDERDVIFIGTVYGAAERGARVMQRFGPINGLSGKRRLNVLLTRAKEKIVTFSSMTSADIEAEETSNPGVYMLKRWLEYAAGAVLDAGEATNREPDSDFEQFVIDQIRAMGCTPVPQVGVAGYFVDIGVRHPDWPHGYVLGVECDGAMYHSAKSARDRDRLRQEILEGLGWRLHRIWSTDWFNNPRQEAERLRRVITDRVASLKARAHEFSVITESKTVGISLSDKPVAETTKVLLDEKYESPLAMQKPTALRSNNRIEVGDTVRVRYLTEDKKTVQITISNSRSDPTLGIVHKKTPVGAALLGAEKGDEVEVLVGSYIRRAIVEEILKNGQ